MRWTHSTLHTVKNEINMITTDLHTPYSSYYNECALDIFNARQYERVIVISSFSFVCLSVYAPFCAYNSKTITSNSNLEGRYLTGYRWIPTNLVKFE